MGARLGSRWEGGRGGGAGWLHASGEDRNEMDAVGVKERAEHTSCAQPRPSWAWQSLIQRI